MLSYAGINLVEVLPDLDNYLQQWADVSWQTQWPRRAVPGYGLESLPWQGYRQQRPMAINSLVWPCWGASRHAVGLFVVDETSLEAIRLAVLTGDGASQDLVIDDGRGNVSYPMYMLPARPIVDADPDGPAKGLYILELVDERYRFWYRNGTISSISSWSALFDRLQTLLEVTISYEAIDADYGTPPDALIKSYHALPVLLDAAAACIGQRLVANADGTFELIRSETAKTRHDASLAAIHETRKLSGDLFAITAPPGRGQDSAVALPFSVTVAFIRNDTGAYAYSIEMDFDTLGIDWFGNFTPFTGTKLIRSSAMADFCDAPSLTDPANVTELTALATWVATDYYQHLYGMPEATYEGAIVWGYNGMDSLIDSLVYKHSLSKTTCFIRRNPWHDHLEDLLHTPPSNPSDCISATASDCIGCGWVAGLISTDCLQLTRLSELGACDLADPAVDETLSYSAGDWISATSIEVGGNLYNVTFDLNSDGTPRLAFTEASGTAPATYYLTLDCCGNDYAIFAAGGTVLCPGTRDCPPTAPHLNIARFKVEWSRCSNPDYHGDGWYCVLYDGDITPVCVHLTYDPGTDGCLTIQAGPWTTEAECTDSCGVGEADPFPCQSINFSTATYSITISNQTGDAVCATTAGTTSTPGGVDILNVVPGTCEGLISMDLSCSGGFYTWGGDVDGVNTIATRVSFNASPFVAIWDFTFADGVIATPGGGGGTLRLTLMVS